MKRTRMRIGGERRGERFDAIRSPYDGETVGEVATASAEDMDDAIHAASHAFERMKRMPTHERVAILERTAAAIEARADDIATLMAREGEAHSLLSR